MQKKHQEPKIDVTIATKDGKVHRITTDALLNVLDRGERYLEAAVSWQQDFERHLMPLCDGPDEEKYEVEHERRFKQIIDRFQIPEDAWFPIEGFSEEDKEEVMVLLGEWINGNLEDFADFYHCLDEENDLDPTFLLFGVPLRRLPAESRRTLHDLAKKFGCWRIGGRSRVLAVR